uniref:RING-type domain-containing protein n=1 Tax=Electrophorus electricus TaxID=8005 RepID=A0A4W4FUX0_ELEEL
FDFHTFAGLLCGSQKNTKRETEKVFSDLSHLCASVGNSDVHCPVCLHSSIFPVQTNCGHLFCAPCLISYWKHSSWLDAISCPLCRQKVRDGEVLIHIRDYNKRYSGTPRTVSDYLCDALLLLLIFIRAVGNIGGLVWLFLLRVALCGFGAAASLVSPLGAVPGPFSGTLGLLDDLLVVCLLLISIINIQQMAPERTARTHGILTNTL